MKLNPTLKKFHYPDSLIKEYKHWYLLLRPEQVTFGSMVLIEKDLKKKLSLINKNSFVELKLIVKKIENYFLNILKFNKINYLILMMKDPHTHIHIIPRHRKDKKFSNQWYCCNDSNVSEITNEQVFNSQNAYILFYHFIG